MAGRVCRGDAVETASQLWPWLVTVWDALLKHPWLWTPASLAIFSGLAWLGHRRLYRRRTFPDLVNFSLNYFEGNQLVFRTLDETSLTEVWRNPHIVGLVKKAKRKTALFNPILRLNRAADMELINQAVVNRLSSLFGAAFLAKSLGREAATATYVFAITYERFPRMATHKLRVLIIREDELVRLAGPQVDGSFWGPKETDRMSTLETMRRMYADPTTSGLLGKMELGVSGLAAARMAPLAQARPTPPNYPSLGR